MADGETMIEDLLTRWRSRDRRYALRRYSVTDAERILIVGWRRTEAEALPTPKERSHALAVLAAWRGV